MLSCGKDTTDENEAKNAVVENAAVEKKPAADAAEDESSDDDGWAQHYGGIEATMARLNQMREQGMRSDIKLMTKYELMWPYEKFPETNFSKEEFAKLRKMDVEVAKLMKKGTAIADDTLQGMEEDIKPGKVEKTEVYPRVRPMSEEESKSDSGTIKSLKTETTMENGTVAYEEVGGFNGLIGLEENNKGMYEKILQPKIKSSLLKGNNLSVFAYGHSGTGKTHSMLGYKDDEGLFKLACRDLFTALNEENAKGYTEAVGPLKLQIRFTEIYLNKVLDLMNERKALDLREDGNGHVHLRAEVVKDETGRVFTGDSAYTLVEDIDHLMKVLKFGIGQRAVGSSAIHDQSSRSHAMLEIELVSEQIVKMREELYNLSGKAAKLNREVDDAKGQGTLKFSMYSQIGKCGINKDVAFFFRSCETEWATMSAKDWLEGWTEFQTSLKQNMTEAMECNMKIADLKQRLEKAFKSGHECLGAQLVLVDLAGADHDTRDLKSATKQELKESASINKELFTLKECMRPMGKRKRKPWRDSSLTRLLKEVLEPTTTKNSQAIMLATCSPAGNQEKDTANTLRYASMVAGFKPPKKKKVDPRTAKIISDIKALYKEFVPEKSEADVDKILAKFKGRERVLFQKVQKKYKK